ncbi:RagB/SusD domain-containing protein (plasmid) [Gemmatirosa kalamazoonensis]|uniref:RagB/SusD domain-containing protein n=1 Tax=Gemmatirosa kalamazoonensis TaxID=861299 RepID=W0RPG5_9BACT|nr:RagB/SusD family nutrient uptake outer membrane protein [Gemmatirosa kalamazoonensis]AHG92382.1 RagB/SusD domain-containing protein [Gemmatirosa kalamazoonensis]
MTRTALLRRIALVPAAVLAGAAACNDLLQVDNPNNVNVEALSNPASAPNQVNGELAALTRGANELVGLVVTASDELTWTGSLDGMDRLNRGFVRDPTIEFVIDATTAMSQARYMAARTVAQLEQFKAANQLTDPTQLALANLYAAVTYDYLANHFDDFVIASAEREAGAPIGSAKMVTLYDSAEAAATRGLALLPATSATALVRGQLTAMRARAKFDRAIWQKLNPSGKAPADPLVSDQGAADDAVAALTIFAGTTGGADARLPLTVTTGMAIGNCFLPSCTNSRKEIAFNPALGSYNYTTRALTVALRDPITNQPDPVLQSLMQEFVTGNLLTTLIATGARDMRLIAAEVALAKGNTTEFATQINALRALNNLPAWTGAAGQPSARDILIHERRVNLFLQGRRLNDMYRFGIVDPAWSAQGETLTCPGAELPIGDIERQTNPNMPSTQPACGS